MAILLPTFAAVSMALVAAILRDFNVSWSWVMSAVGVTGYFIGHIDCWARGILNEKSSDPTA